MDLRLDLSKILSLSKEANDLPTIGGTSYQPKKKGSESSFVEIKK